MRKTLSLLLTTFGVAWLLLPTECGGSPLLLRTQPNPAVSNARGALRTAHVAAADFGGHFSAAQEPSPATAEPEGQEPSVDVDADKDDHDVEVDHDGDMDHDAEMNEDLEQDADHDEPDVDIDIDADHDDARLTVRAEEKIQKSFSMPAGAARRSLEIDNIWGSIEVVGTASDQAQLTVNKTIRAESKEKLEQARKDVTLDITEQPGSLKFYVNGPFRCQCNDCSRSRDDDGYIVKMDFQLRVPRDIDIRIKTVNEGRVSVRDINGDFLVRNVNGDIEIRDVSGSGTARTVNGPVKVSFRQNPRAESDFRTVNGNIELQFAHDLAADFRFKTFNGSVYSDFPVTALPVHGMQEEHHGGKVVFRADRYMGARVNSGGPEIKVENLNGDIRILQSHE